MRQLGYTITAKVTTLLHMLVVPGYMWDKLSTSDNELLTKSAYRMLHRKQRNGCCYGFGKLKWSAKLEMEQLCRGVVNVIIMCSKLSNT